MKIAQNQVIELAFVSKKTYENPYRHVQISMIVEEEGGSRTVPGFWDGGQSWKIRYSSARTGSFRYRTICSDASNPDLHGQEGRMDITPYTGSNPLYRHGPVRKSGDNRYLEHEDGKPFFWLADTWWMSLTKRIKWPEEYKEMASDRVNKGFSVIQIVAGLYPDMHPFDERGANEAGFPWNSDFTEVNPAYFQKADERIAALVEDGLMPCLVGSWGFYLDFAGEAAMKRHWDYLIARYGALPVVWCIAGEASMPFYQNPNLGNKEKMAEYEVATRRGWTEVTRYVKERDPYGRMITIHSTQYGHKEVDDPSLLDLDMLQTGHSSFTSIPNTITTIRNSVARKPRLPAIIAEVCYEGIGGSSYHDIQRFFFWSSVLSGTCGHTYGANGIWQINGTDEPYGRSPYGKSWGNLPWNEAYRLPGSLHVGLGKKLLERYRWWKFESHPEWVEQHADDHRFVASYAAGIPGEVRLIFLPFLEGLLWGGVLVKQIEQDSRYRAYYYDPISGEDHDLGKVVPNEQGEWRSGATTAFQDWVLVLEKEA
ncbi:apiosidase-like domain-containing protein [Paenibacillus spongiae]|uniref:DUF4038 domain-containing protein n=1 Tax=Paenibacillus spongiae TaxID=2909671 RepID=A0ABY5S0P0_9BACL|nr:DUF4038 domain-containing protein [Paenibacillus spongiae]UVI27412.1 DUF4038 domain-containing protein [Paenibacillus spongiae]